MASNLPLEMHKESLTKNTQMALAASTRPELQSINRFQETTVLQKPPFTNVEVVDWILTPIS
jgi:hypothetical protein